MLTPDELDLLATDLWDLICERAQELAEADGTGRYDGFRGAMTAMLEVDAGIAQVTSRVTARVDAAARQWGMSYAAIGAARRQSKQAVQKRVAGVSRG